MKLQSIFSNIQFSQYILCAFAFKIEVIYNAFCGSESYKLFLKISALLGIFGSVIAMQQWRVFAFADEADPSFEGQLLAMKRNGLAGLEIRGVDGENISKITPLRRG